MHSVFCSCVLDVPLVSHFTISIFGQLHSALLCIVLWPFVSSYSRYDLRSSKIFPSTSYRKPSIMFFHGWETNFCTYTIYKETKMSFELNLMWYSIYEIHTISQVGLKHFTLKTSIRAIHCQSLLHLTNMFSVYY